MFVFCMDNNKTPLFSCTVLTYFYTENVCVYCAVRTKSLKVIQVNLILQMGAPWRWPLTSEANFQSWPRQCEVCSREGQRDRVSPKTSVFSFLSVPLNPRSILIFSLHCSYHTDKQQKPGNPEIKHCFSEYRGKLERKVISFRFSP